MTFDAFIASLRAAAASYAEVDAHVSGAKLLAKLIADLEQISSALSDQPVTLAEASRLSGYSPDHLARLVRQGRIRNVGRKGAPRVLVGDLPRRPPRSSLAPPVVGSYDAQTDARFLRVRR